MKYFFFLILITSSTTLASTKQDSINEVFINAISEIKNNDLNIDLIKLEYKKLNEKFDYQERLNETTLNSISHQIGATSYNLTIFGILFTLAALGLGIYVTNIERKIVGIRESTKHLLKQTLDAKKDVEAINTLIQKDIYGLFLKIKREETVHILNRLLKIPEDISNLSNELLSRELEKSDFKILKEIYSKVKPDKVTKPGEIRLSMPTKDMYLLLFFQHFLDLVVVDEIIGPDMTKFYTRAINCAFQNDIVKSTEDFNKGILDKGFQNCEVEINCFMIGLSQSDFKDFDKVFEILFNGLKNREDRFKFFDLIANDQKSHYGKLKFGKLLKANYFNKNVTKSEEVSFIRLQEIQDLIEKK